MAELWIEALGGIAYIFFYTRTGYHIKATFDEKRSVTPPKYHYLSFFGNAFLGIYGFYLGSILLPINAVFTLFHSLYHVGMDKGWFNNFIGEAIGICSCGGKLIKYKVPRGLEVFEYSKCNECGKTKEINSVPLRDSDEKVK